MKSSNKAQEVPDDTSPEASGKNFVFVGEITKPHGIRGELSLHFVGESPDILRENVLLAPPVSPASRASDAEPAAGSLVSMDVEKIRSHHGSLLLTLKGCDDRDKAEKLRRNRVYVPREKLPPLAEEEYYLADMLGLAVIAASADGQEKEIGHIDAIDVPAGQELWTILTPDGDEILFPAVPEFVLDIDMEAGTARIAPPPGLLELYIS